MFLLGVAVGAVGGLVVAVVVPAVFRWATKQVSDANSHM